MASTTRDHDGPFRDYMPGMEGRRSDLLNRRRAELATMPHALRRVYVARVARVAAAATATLGGTVLIGASIHPGYEQYLGKLLPGQLPAVLSTLLLGTLVLSALAYLLGRCIAEARFTHAMSKCVLPDGDVCTDVERLKQVRPDEVASAMIARFESPAAVLPPAGLALAAPCALAYGAMAAMAGGYPKEAIVDAAFAAQGSNILAIGMAGIAAALYLGLTRKRQAWKRTGALAIAAAAATTLGFHVFTAATAIVWGGFAIIAAGIAGTIALLRQEHQIVVLDDPGATLWTVRGTIASAWSMAKEAGAKITIENLKKLPSQSRAFVARPAGRFAALGLVLAVACGGYLSYDGGSELAIQQPTSQGSAFEPLPAGGSIPVLDSHTQAPKPRTGTVKVNYTTITGSMQLDSVNGSIALMSSKRGAVRVPAGFTAKITVELLSGDDQPLSLLVNGEAVETSETGTIKWHRLDASKRSRVLGIATAQEPGQSHSLHYQVTLTPLPTSE